MGESMNHSTAHALTECPITDRLHVSRSFLPILETGECLQLNDIMAINARCRSNLFHQHQQVDTIRRILGMVDPKFTPRNIECTQCFECLYGYIVKRWPGSTGLRDQF